MSDPRPAGPTRAGLAVGIAVCVVLVGLPVVITIASAFGVLSSDGTFAAPTVRDIRLTLGSADFLRVLGYTLLLAAGGALIALCAAVALATFATRVRLPSALRSWLQWTPVLPFLLPSVLVFLGWQVLYSDRAGLANILLRQLLGISGNSGPISLRTLPLLVVAMGAYLTPIAYLFVHGALSATPPELEMAAQVFGARWSRVVATVTVPLARPAVAAAALVVFVLGMSNYVVPATIKVSGVQNIPNDMAAQLHTVPPSYAAAAVLAAVLLAISVVALAIRQRFERLGRVDIAHRSSAVADGGRYDLGALRWVGVAVFGLFVLLTAILPVLGIVSLSFRPFWTTTFNQHSFSLHNFHDLGKLAPFAAPALRNSVLMSVICATITLVLGFWLARLITAGHGRLSRLLEALSLLPAAIPGVLVGVSVVLPTIRLLPALYGTAVPVGFAYVILFLPFSVQICLAALRRVPSELEWASTSLGAGRFLTLYRVVLPQVAPQLLGAWTICAVFSLREVDAAVMLVTRGFPLAGPEMLTLWGNGYAPAAAALGVQILLASIALSFFGYAVLAVFRLTLFIGSWRRRRAPGLATASNLRKVGRDAEVRGNV